MKRSLACMIIVSGMTLFSIALGYDIPFGEVEILESEIIKLRISQ